MTRRSAAAAARPPTRWRAGATPGPRWSRRWPGSTTRRPPARRPLVVLTSSAPMAELEYTIRRSDRARRARIVVNPSGVEVVVPRRMALRHVEPFVEEKRPWIERTLRRFREAELSAPPVELEHGGVVPYLGRELLLNVRVESWRQRPHVAQRGEVLRVKVGSPGPDAIRDALERWFRARAREEVAWRLDEACAR